MLMYLVIFLSTLVVDLIPIIAPPAWTIMVFLLVKCHLDPWVVLIVGVTGSTIGRYIFSLYVPYIADRLIKRRKKDELQFMGRKLTHNFWQSWFFSLIGARCCKENNSPSISKSGSNAQRSSVFQLSIPTR